MKIKLIRCKFLLSLIFSGFCTSSFCQIAKEGPNAQYLYENFIMSEVKMKNGQALNASMNYNIVTEKMVFIRDDQYYDLITNNVDTVRLGSQIFIPAGNVCYELLIPDSISLYARHTGRLLDKGSPAGYGGTSQVSASSYQSTIDLSTGTHNLPLPSRYYVEETTEFRLRNGAEWLSFNNEKEFLKLFPEKNAKLKDFIRQNKLKVSRTDHMILIIEYLNN
jgi:hypothetical protein